MRVLNTVLPLLLITALIALSTGCTSAESVLGEEAAARIPDGADQVRIQVDEPPEVAVEYVREFLRRNGVGVHTESQEGRQITTTPGEYHHGENVMTFNVSEVSNGSYIDVTSQFLAGKGWRTERAGSLGCNFPSLAKFLTGLAPLSRMEFINSEESGDDPIISAKR